MDIYTSLEEAKEEIWRRWKNASLREKVTNYLGQIPPLINQEPRAYLDRTVISPDNEYTNFIEKAKKANLRYIGFEYLKDKFVTINPDKFGLARMAFYHGKNRSGEAIINHRCIIDCTAFDGEHFDKIITLWGEPLVDFHHRILFMNPSPIELFEASSWFMFHGGNAAEYYHKFLALFICHGILFEDYIKNEKEENRFFVEVVIPSFKRVFKIFGVKPLIIPLLTSDRTSIDKYWYCYPTDIEKEVIRCLNGCPKNNTTNQTVN